jgi:hypothetical protein
VCLSVFSLPVVTFEIEEWNLYCWDHIQMSAYANRATHLLFYVDPRKMKSPQTIPQCPKLLLGILLFEAASWAGLWCFLIYNKTQTGGITWLTLLNPRLYSLGGPSAHLFNRYFLPIINLQPLYTLPVRYKVLLSQNTDKICRTNKSHMGDIANNNSNVDILKNKNRQELKTNPKEEKFIIQYI